jgi:hypothetical protein
MENQEKVKWEITPDRFLIGVEPQCKGIEFEMTLNLTYQEFEDIVKLKYPGIHLSDKPGSIDRHFVFNVMEGDITIISYDKPTHVKGIILDHGGKGEWGPLFVKRFEEQYPVSMEEQKEPTGQQRLPTINIKSQLPKRPTDLRRWNQIWNIVRGKIRAYPTNNSLTKWFKTRPKMPGDDLKCSYDTMKKIVMAGEAGLLDLPKVT